MSWNWYLRHANEILIDLDGKTERTYSAKLQMVRRRFEGSVSKKYLLAKAAYFYPSFTSLHHHLIIVCERDLTLCEAQAWALYLGSDIFRAANNLMRREFIMGKASDLLISQTLYPFRKPDYQCNCTAKHTPDVMELCHVAYILRGGHREFFGLPADNKPVWDTFGQIYKKGDAL